MSQILEATGCTIRPELLKKEAQFFITQYGAGTEKSPVENTKAINAAIEAAGKQGGEVIFPAGEFKVYTILLKSNVNLYLSKGCVLRAAKTELTKSYTTQKGEGGNYMEPEVNPYAGLQDHGHSYFANSLVYGADLENIMIYGEGVMDGSSYDEDGYRTYTLLGGDPFSPEYRNQPGHRGEWFGNKGIALVRCKNVVLQQFSLVIGGHFAIITEGVINMLVEHVCVDTTRDAFDIDCCQDVTVRHSVFNSLTDDALVMKASYGAGLFLPTQNVLIEDCTVSGYDAGSVYAKTYTTDKLIAEDRCGPTARVKFGTESTCGYHQVTIRRVEFDRSRGFAMEAVDGSDLTDVIFSDCKMKHVSSSPIFIKIGDRGRFPVTGYEKTEELQPVSPNIRLDHPEWILPDTSDYTHYPAKRYTPSYQRKKEVRVDGHSSFFVVDQEQPAGENPANIAYKDGQAYGKTYAEGQGYVLDDSQPLTQAQILCRANGNGSARIAKVANVRIENVTIEDADPRYPILLMGLLDSPIENLSLKNISVEYRGGMTMEHAVEQRQLNTKWDYTQFETAPSVQSLPWLVNTFFLKNEGLLPRLDWQEDGSWMPDPYNVPELPEVYPEPSNWGILPAYGLYARHVQGMEVENLEIRLKTPDGRHSIVLDDVHNVQFRGVTLPKSETMADVAIVTNHFKRPTNEEYIKELPYSTTTVTGLELPQDFSVKLVTVEAPAPGTPSDSYYPHPTLAIPENGYHYEIPTERYPLPRTVFRPFIQYVPPMEVVPGEEVKLVLKVRDPAGETSIHGLDPLGYDEGSREGDYTVAAQPVPLTLRCENLPEGAQFCPETKTFTYTPKSGDVGEHMVRFVLDDGVIPETLDVLICVKEEK